MSLGLSGGMHIKPADKGGIHDFAGWAEFTLHYSIKAERNSPALIFRCQ